MTRSPFPHGLVVTLLAMHFFAPAAKCDNASDIDSEAYWAKGRESIARLGDGFIVWESLRTDRWRIWTIKLDGAGLHQLTADEPGRDHYAPKINPGGTKMIYLSLPADAATNDRPLDVRGELHLIDIDGKNDHVIVHGAMKYNGWDRAVVWFNDRTLAYIGPDANTYQLDLDTGASELIIKGGQCWLPNTKRTHAVWSFNTFSIFNAKAQTVSPMPHLGGCQCYFTPDGVWGFWMRAPGGPIYKMFLETRDISPLVDQALLPPERRFLYFPMVSNDQRLVAFGAAPTARVTDYVHTDYDIFVAPIDPATLEVTGPAVRYTFDPKCDRFPDVYQSPLALGYHTDKVPYDVSLTSSGITGEWEWRFGDSDTATKATLGKHTYRQPGTYVVEARQGDQVVRGQVRVAAAVPPQALGAALESNREIVVSFNEPVSVASASVHLESGAKIEQVRPDAGGRSLHVFLSQPAANADVLLLDGITDQAQKPNRMTAARLPFPPRQWPANTRDLVFAWETGDKPNKVVDPRTGQVCAYAARDAGISQLDHNWAMTLNGGWFSITDFHDQFSNAVRGAESLSLEATITPAGADSDGACIMTYGLYQIRDKLVYRYGNSSTELCALPIGQTSHVIVTYSPGHLACYLNGSRVFLTDKLRLGLTGYPTGPLTLGNTLDGQTWRGTIEGIALYARELSEEEARANAEAYARLRTARKAVERIEVEARLLAASKTPTPAKIQPYRSALAMNEYAIDKVISGHIESRKVRVTDWAILDGTTTRVAQIPPGAVVRLTLEPAAANKQLQGQYQADTLPEDFESPVYFATEAAWDDVRIPAWKMIVPAAAPVSREEDLLEKPLAPERFEGGPGKYPPADREQWIVARPNADAYVSFLGPFKSHGNGCGYAIAYVKSPDARKITMTAASVGGLKAWVNGKEVIDGRFGRYPFPGQRNAPIELNAGWNEICIKTTQLYAFWGFSCDLLSIDGREMRDVEYTTEKPRQ